MKHAGRRDKRANEKKHSISRVQYLILAVIAISILFFIFHLANFTYIIEPERIGSEIDKKAKLSGIIDVIEHDKDTLLQLFAAGKAQNNIDTSGATHMDRDVNQRPSTTRPEESKVAPPTPKISVTIASELKPPNKIFQKHRILTLDDEAFKNTPISVMMSWYGEADGGNSCKEDFGNELVLKWRHTKKSFCDSTKRY